jgi:signal transduction histidine kinase
VLREALSNVARHAQASAVQVHVDVAGDRLVLQVADDGRGVGEPERASGLEHMRRRAARHGGELVLRNGSTRGTQLFWTAELGAAAD